MNSVGALISDLCHGSGVGGKIAVKLAQKVGSANPFRKSLVYKHNR
jgi:hypothetical protein